MRKPLGTPRDVYRLVTRLPFPEGRSVMRTEHPWRDAYIRLRMGKRDGTVTTFEQISLLTARDPIRRAPATAPTRPAAQDPSRSSIASSRLSVVASDAGKRLTST